MEDETTVVYELVVSEYQHVLIICHIFCTSMPVCFIETRKVLCTQG